MNLGYRETTNLENSMYEFLVAALATDSLTVKDDKGNNKEITVRVGETFNADWSLPTVSLYEDSELAPRGFIGNNRRIKDHLLIIDIRALDSRMRKDLTDWVTDTINDGFPFYEYTQSGDPDNPNKVQTGYVRVDFLFNRPLRLGDTVDMVDKYRQNISINCGITLIGS